MKLKWIWWVALAILVAFLVAFLLAVPSALSTPSYRTQPASYKMATVDSLPIPYKTPYHLSEFWPMLLKGTLWAGYAKANPKEAEALNNHAQRKINQQADFIPTNLTHTFTGNALLMVILTLYA